MRITWLFPICLILCSTYASADVSLTPNDRDNGEPQLSDTGTDVFIPEPQVEKFWEEAQKLGPQAGDQVFDQVMKASSPEVASGISDFKNALTQVVEQARRIRTDIQKAIEKKDITMEHVTEMFSREITGIYDEIKDQVNDLLSKDHGEASQDPKEKARTRAKLVDKVMDKAQAAYIRVLIEVGVPREQAEKQSRSFFAMLKRVLLILGKLVDKYPVLLESLIFAASMLFLPQISILRPIMTLIGFGPLGPIRGTVAAWAQRVFFGGIIPAGSWFAILQKVGMTLAGSWLEKLAASVGLAALLGFTGRDREEL